MLGTNKSLNFSFESRGTHYFTYLRVGFNKSVLKNVFLFDFYIGTFKLDVQIKNLWSDEMKSLVEVNQSHGLGYTYIVCTIVLK